MHTHELSKATVRALAKKGVAVVGRQALPDASSSMPYANASRGYVLSDNGVCRVRSHAEVLAMAEEA
jgi:hypothetical protein